MPSRSQRDPQRYNTAVHEAGHVVIARACRTPGVRAKIWNTARGARGMTWVRRWRGSDQDLAAYLLAGSTAGRMITGDVALAGSDDLDAARTVLGEIGEDWDVAQRRTLALLRPLRREILRTADDLYTRGRVG